MTGAGSELSPLKRAFLALEALQRKVAELELPRTEPIAVVGLACRFPGAVNADQFWELLRGGVDAISQRPEGRWASDPATVDASGEDATRWGGFLSSVDTFDPQFFGIAPREAIAMDPQQRLFLEVCWEALEHAGIAPDRLNGTATGVFVGVCTNDYSNMQTRGGDLSGLGTHYASGIAHSIIPGRLSYLLGLRGPSVAVDTACSSSLVAVHLACQALRSGDCEMALAGGVNVVLLPDNAMAFACTGMMAVDGRCKPFDAAADGFVRGEGSGVVVLKRLSKAIADGDTIHALIRGSAVNQDGASSGMTAPSGPAQEAVIRGALRAAGVRPSEVRYVEAHGTGTVLGDPIEAQAIGAALGADRPAGDAVLVGSVKSNLGHLEASAGVAGLIKTILALKNGAIPASLHFRTPNPLIPWERLPVRVPTELTPWESSGAPRVAGVSSFGFGGTNAHVIVSEAPAAKPVQSATVERPRHLLLLSAPTETGLRALADSYAGHITAHPEQSLADIAHTANVGRARFRHRAALPIGPDDEVAARLRAFAASAAGHGVHSGETTGSHGPRVVFLFSGQGSQYPGMGRHLYETQPSFRRVLTECDELLRAEVQPGILDVLYSPGEAGALLDRTAYTQPVLFALEYALASLWQSWGVKPSAVMGHSLGEYVAATVAGVLRLEDALRFVTIRGRLSQKLPPTGAMAAVLASVERVRDVLASLGDLVTVAAINAPENNVISGPREAVAAATASFVAQGIEVKPLAISNAFHSRAIEPMLAEFEGAASRISFGTQRVPVFSNLYGRRAAEGEMSDGSYWAEHLRQPVQFAAGFSAAIADGYTTFLEVGPHTTLLGLGRQCFPDSPGAWLPSLRRDYDDWTILLDSLAELHARGVAVDGAAFDRDYPRRRVALPTYPFERQRYWAAPGKPLVSGTRRAPGPHPLLARRIASPFIDDPIFETELSLDTVPWCEDHRVLGSAVLPTTAYLESIWAGARLLHGDAVAAIEDLDIHEALVIPDGTGSTMQLSFSDAASEAASFRVVSSVEEHDGAAKVWHSHASGTVSLRGRPREAAGADLDAIRARCPRRLSPSQLYEALAVRGIALGPRFRGLDAIHQGEGEALGRLDAPPDLAGELAGYHMHPALLDAALQVVTAALLSEADLGEPGQTYMPVAVERFRVLKPAAGELWSHATARQRAESESPIADIRVYDGDGAPVAEVTGLQLRRVEAPAWAAASPGRLDDQLYRIEWKAASSSESPAEAATEWNAPAPSEIAASVSRSVDDLAARHGMAEYGRRLPELDALCRDLIIEAVSALGWRPAPATRVDEPALAAELGIAAQHRRLFGRLLGILAEDGLLAREGEGWVVERPLLATPTKGRLDELRAEFPGATAELGLLASTGPELARCLAGHADPLSLLFPGGRLDAADDLYRRSPPALLLNALARQAVEAIVEAAPAGAALRVLEIGAGTGGTTSFVLPALPAERTRYRFTDLSPLFLARAQERMSEHRFIDYGILDIERDASSQGLEPGSFDLVIAANVLHATRDLAETLAHARRLVRPGGALVLLEGTSPQRWIDLTFGLTDGWWRFTDRALRPDYPLIGRRQWHDALGASGFDEVAATPGEGSGPVLEQNLLVIARTPVARREQWIVFADSGGAGHAVARDLRAAGRDVVSVRPGRAFRRDGTDVELPEVDAAAYRRLIDELTGEGHPQVAGVVHLWSLDAVSSSDASTVELHAAHERGSRSALYLAQALTTRAATTSCKLVLATRGAQPVKGADVSALAAACMWGLAGTIRLEHPDLECVCVDLDPNASEPANGLAARILSRSEQQLGVRDSRWYAARLVRLGKDASGNLPERRETVDERVYLVNTTPGVLDGLRFIAAERQPPGPGEVEIRVTTAALNFRDVLIAMGLYPGTSAAERLGGECAGEIVAVGPGVPGLARGDSVVAMAPGGLGSHAITRAELVLALPPGLTPREAVTMPSAFMTAWHSLYDLAGLRSGERVLIHAGAGGVGLAAIQLARRVGATVFATAGSPEKRAFLASLGVDHVMDSRSVAYAEEIAAFTDGKGVNVVLNSLADRHIASSLSVLAEGGRFVELGKRGIWSEAQVREYRPSLRYFVVDLAAVGAERPAVLGAVLRNVDRAVRAGEITPLRSTEFTSGDVTAAFRFMAQAKHIGKIVVTRAHVADPSAVRGDGTYLITGGLGGLGMVVARRLLERGAGHVVLMSRGDAGEAARAAIEEWNRGGPRVSIVRGDVGDEHDVRCVLAHVASQEHPLRGVIHAAGALHDGVLAGQDWSQFSRTFGPKIDGTWHLHRLTQHAALDFFVLFSSISALFGSPGQGNHAAANAFMDGMAHHRRARGLPALSINWGAWEEVGAATKHNVAARIGAQGMGTIPPSRGIELLERLMRENPTQAAAMPVDWGAFGRRFAGGRLQRTLLAEVIPAPPAAAARAAKAGEPAAESSFASALRAAPVAARRELLRDRVRALAAKVLGLESLPALACDRPLQELGLDSLMAVELRNLMKSDLGLERAPSATVVFDYPTVQALSEYVEQQLFGGAASAERPGAQAASAHPLDAGSEVLGGVEELSEEMAAELLAARLSRGR